MGRDTYTNDLLELAGGRNVAEDAKGSVLFSAERLIQADPDMILCVGEASDAAALAARARHRRSEGRRRSECSLSIVTGSWLAPDCQHPWRRFAP